MGPSPRIVRNSLLTGARQAEGCLAVGEERDLFDFVLVATLENGRLVAQSIDVPAEQPA